MSQDFPDDATGDVLRRMKARGDRLEEVRDIDFSLVFSDEADAQAFCRALSKLGLPAVLEPFDPEDGQWDVTVTRPMAATYDAIAAFEARLSTLAEPFSGELDGWGCWSRT